MIEIVLPHDFAPGIDNNLHYQNSKRHPYTKQYSYNEKKIKEGCYPVNIITEEILNG